jgi:hypothetical protein
VSAVAKRSSKKKPFPTGKKSDKNEPYRRPDGEQLIARPLGNRESLTKEANVAWISSMLAKQVETTVKDADGNSTTTSMPFNEFAAEKQLRYKKYEFTSPGRSRAKFLAGRPYEEVSPPKQVKSGEKVKSGDIDLTKSEAYTERRYAKKLENIQDEYEINRQKLYMESKLVPKSSPSKPKKTEPTLAERTRVGRKDMA